MSRPISMRLVAVYLLAGLVDVAEVGEEEALLGRDHAGAVRAREAGQVADVHHVRDEEAVELELLDLDEEPVGPRRRVDHCIASLSISSAVTVAVDALALHGAHAEVADHRQAPPLLAPVDRREVDLDGRQAAQLERVVDRPRVVRPGARIEHEAVGALAGAVQELAVLALVVRLVEAHLEAELARVALDLDLELGEA